MIRNSLEKRHWASGMFETALDDVSASALKPIPVAVLFVGGFIPAARHTQIDYDESRGTQMIGQRAPGNRWNQENGPVLF